MAQYGPYQTPWIRGSMPGPGPTPPPPPVGDYTELQYIHFSGTEWLDTGYAPGWFFDTSATSPSVNSRRIDAIIEAPSDVSYSTSRWAFGVYDSTLTDASRRFLFGQTMSDGGTTLQIRPMAEGAGSGGGLPASYSIAKGLPLTISVYFYTGGRNYAYSASTMYQDGQYIAQAATAYQANKNFSEMTVWLGGRNRGYLDAPWNQLNVYSWAIWTGEAKLSWVPARRNSDGVCGLLKGNDFIPMQGTNITYASGAGGPEAN